MTPRDTLILDTHLPNGAGVSARPAGGLAPDEWSESQLSLPRAKPRSIAISVAYRLTRLLRAVLGTERVLRLHLFLAWLTHRLAFEESIALYGDRFRCAGFALTERTMQDWLPPGGTVLDLGCGVGRWSRIASRFAGSVVGVDYDPVSIEIAQRQTREPNVTYILSDITRPLSEVVGGRSFDVVLLLHVLEHIEDVSALLVPLREIAEAIIVEVPDFEADSLNAVRWRIGAPFYSDADHVQEYTLDIMRAQLSRNGWDPQESERRGGVILVRAVRSRVAPAHAGA